MIRLILIILTVIILIYAWVKISMHKWTKLENDISLYIVMMFHVSRQEGLSLVRGFSYCAYGGLMAGIMLHFSNNSPLIFDINDRTIILSVLGAFAELSIVRLFTLIYSVLHPEFDLIDEIQKVRWIKGAFKLSPKFAFITIVSAAVIEELFFRGSVMYLLLGAGASQLFTLLIVTLLFVYEQVLLVETRVQKDVIGITSAVISIIGGLLVLTTGTIWPAMLAHASFVIFYVRKW